MQTFDATERWWKCKADPYSHSFLDIYCLMGKEPILKECMKPGAKRPSFLIQLRDPVERFGSLLLFGLGAYTMALKSCVDSPKEKLSIEITLQNIERAYRNVTVSGLREFFHCMAKGGKRNYEYKLATKPKRSRQVLKHSLNTRIYSFLSYQMLLGNREDRVFSGVNDPAMVSSAIENLRQDFDIVGITEHMPSLFVLLSARFNITIQSTCDKFITRATSHRNIKIFGSAVRPPTRETFSKEVIDFLQNEFLVGEQKIYNEGLRIHKEQLHKYGYTIASATELWDEQCAELKGERRSKSFVPGAMT